MACFGNFEIRKIQMNAYIWFQYGSFAYGFSGVVERRLEPKHPSNQNSLSGANMTSSVSMLLDTVDVSCCELSNFLEEILVSSKHLVRIDLAIKFPTGFKQPNLSSSASMAFESQELRLFTRRNPQLKSDSTSVRILLDDLEGRTPTDFQQWKSCVPMLK
jgi:hypothetical protein